MVIKCVFTSIVYHKELSELKRFFNPALLPRGRVKLIKPREEVGGLGRPWGGLCLIYHLDSQLS